MPRKPVPGPRNLSLGPSAATHSAYAGITRAGASIGSICSDNAATWADDGSARIAILGAGPTGLGAAYRLKELGYSNFQVFERNGYIGGLAHSFVDDHGFTWDIGGHVMFSHYSYYDQIFERLMGDEFTLNNRESWVRMFDRWVPYPFQNNIRYLPPQAAFECMSGLIKAQGGRGKVPSPAQATNFGEFIDAVFGEGIARHFMRPYNFKVWAHQPEEMNKTWIGERVAVIDVERALKNIMLGQDDFGWGPNNQFKFPLRGGTGEFYRRFGPVLGLDEANPDSPEGHIRLNRRVESIDADRRVLYFADGTSTRYDVLVSAMPLDVLCRGVLVGDVPAEIRHAAGRLKHSSGYMVGLGLRARDGDPAEPRGVGCTPSTKSWMYFPEDNCPFYRATYLSNYSPHMTPDKDRFWSLLCEVSESAQKPTPGEFGKNPDAVIDDVIRGCLAAGLMEPADADRIVSRWCYYADYSYPTPSVERDDLLAEVIPWLESRSIYSRGRFGMWKYEVANTDHTLMQGVELINRLMNGEPETTIGMTYRITEDGRQAAVHERPAHAGSGEKRIKSAPRVVVRSATAKPGMRQPANGTHGPVGDRPEADVSEEELGVTQR
ncbi:MAG: FAD-dependent oxidoreductase [Phycisphaeraceae bacterium]|nr:FAD-dependent oxidoreductase [Phycisphaeraceae bacterium]